MGCDIHLFVEYKVGDSPWQVDKCHKIVEEDDGEYKYLEQMPFSGRNYNLFARLAGVRGDGPDPRGLPKDVSEIISSNTEENEQYGQYGDDHSHSWSTLEEFKQALTDTGYDLSKRIKNVTLETDVEYKDRYLALISYVEDQILKFKTELEVEKQLLGQEINTDVEARVVYWFDN